jgi:hypothetical protein
MLKLNLPMKSPGGGASLGGSCRQSTSLPIGTVYDMGKINRVKHAHLVHSTPHRKLLKSESSSWGGSSSLPFVGTWKNGRARAGKRGWVVGKRARVPGSIYV